MDDRPTLIQRMNTALDRIDAAIRQQKPQVGGDPDLKRRHDALRAKTEAALRELDALIAREEAR
jgi:hypothetical protein